MEEKLKVGDKVTQDVYELVMGLKLLGDLNGLFFKLERLEKLSLLIDETIESDRDVVSCEKEILDAAFWQRSILDEIRTILDNQDKTIMKLQNQFAYSANNRVTISSHGAAAALSLGNLFRCGEHIGNKIELPELRGWCRTYGFDCDTILSMLGIEKEREPLEALEAI